MVDPGTAITLIGAAASTVKKLIGLTKDIKNIEVNSLVVDLQGNLVDLKSEIVDLKEEILSLREKNVLLEQQAKQRDETELVEQEGAYWTKDMKKGPYCTACFDSNGERNRLTELKGLLKREIADYECKKCTGRFHKKSR